MTNPITEPNNGPANSPANRQKAANQSANGGENNPNNNQVPTPSNNYGGSNVITYDSQGNRYVNGQLSNLAKSSDYNSIQALSQGKNITQQELDHLSDIGVFGHDVQNEITSEGTAIVGGQQQNAKQILAQRSPASFAESKPKPAPPGFTFQTKTPANVSPIGWGFSQNVRGSQDETNLLASEAARAGKNLPNNENADYATGGTPFTGSGGPPTKQSQGLNFGQQAKGQLIRNSVFENNTQQSEADRALLKIINNENPDYATGGTPQNTLGGPVTKQSLFLQSKTSFGWGNDQLQRGSVFEDNAQQNEAARAGLKTTNNENADFATGGTPFIGTGGPPTKQSQGKNFGWNSMKSNQLFSGSVQEANALIFEANRAALIYPKTIGENLDYANGGTPNNNLGGPQTAKSQGLNFGYGSGKLGNQLISGSINEQNTLTSEAARAGKNLPNNENPDYPNGGTPLSLGGAGPATAKSQGINFGWGSMKSDQLIPGSVNEQNVLVSEAARAGKNLPNNENADYPNGGTPPQQNGAGPVTPNLVGNGLPNNNIIGVSPSSRQSGKSYTVSLSENLGINDVIGGGSSGAKSVTKTAWEVDLYENVGVSDSLVIGQVPKGSKPSAIDLFTNQGPQGGVFPAKPQGPQNNSSEMSQQQFDDYVSSSISKGGQIEVFANGKQIGVVSGPNALSTIQGYETQYPKGISVLVTYPEKESALTTAVKQNPNIFLAQPQNFWNNLAKNGYLSSNNIKEVQNTLNLESEVETRQSGLSLYDSAIKSAYLQSENGQASSLLRFPFSGSKQYNDIESFFLKYDPVLIGNFNPLTRLQSNNQPKPEIKSSTSLVPSTSLVDVLPLNPSYGSFAVEAGTSGLELLLAKYGIDLSKTGPVIKNSVQKSLNLYLQNQAKEGAILYANRGNTFNGPITEKPIGNTLTPTQIRKIEATNITQKSPEESVYYNTGKGIFDSATYGNNIGKDYQDFNNAKLAKDIASSPKNYGGIIIANPTQPKPIIPEKSPVKQSNSEESAFNVGTFYTPRTSPLPKEYQDVINNVRGELNLSDLTISTSRTGSASQSPILTETTPQTFVGVQPTGENLQYQYSGIFPTKYTPESSSVLGAISDESIPPESLNPLGRRGKPAVNFGLTGETTQSRASVVDQTYIRSDNEVYSAGGTKLSGLFGDLGKPFGALKSSSKKVINESRPPEEVNILGRRGKPAVKNNQSLKNPIDFLQIPRSEYVERGTISSNQEVYSSKGFKLKNEFGDILYGDLTKPKGALSSIKSISISESIPPESLNPLGRRGKPAVNFGLTGETTQSRASVVDQTYIRSDNEVYSAGGTKLSGLFGDFSLKNFIKGKALEQKLSKLDIYDMGKIFTRGSLKNKDVGTIRFDDYQKLNQKHDEGDYRFNKDVENAAKLRASFESNKKSKSSNISWESTIKSNSKIESGFKDMFNQKGKTSKTPNLGFENKSQSGSKTILENPKPRVKNNLNGESTLANDYDITYSRTPPESKENGIFSSGIKGGILSNLKVNPILLPKSKSSFKLDNLTGSSSKLDNLSQNILLPKQNTREFSRTNSKQNTKNIPKILVTPKQTPSSRSSQKQKNNPDLVPKPKTKQTPSSQFKAPTPFTQIPVTNIPPLIPVPKPNWGNFNKKGGYKSKEGPTAIRNLSVSNIFASSFDIKVPKNKRFEF